MSGIDLIFMAVFCFILGYAMRDGIQISKDYKEAMTRLDEIQKKAMDDLSSRINEIRIEYQNNQHEGIWGGFCPKCRSVHGAGECAGKWNEIE